MNFNFKKLFYILIPPALVAFVGCSDTNKGKTRGEGTAPPTEEITAQLVFDEAAKGVGKTDLKRLLDLYDKFAKDKTNADALAATKDPSSGDHFLCKLLALPTVAETNKILSDLLGKVSNPVNVINDPCKGAKPPMDLLIETTRTVAGDKADDLQAMITVLVDKGDATTIGAANDKPKMEKMLDAVKSKGDQTKFSKVVAKVKTAINQMIVDEAAKGPGVTDLARLKNLFVLKVIDLADALALAAQEPTNKSADRFPNFLAKLQAVDDTQSIWNDFLNMIHNNTPGGAGAADAAVAAQINFVGAGATPFVLLAKGVRPAADAADKLNEIIAKMVEFGNATTIRSADDQPSITRMLDAVLAKGTPSILKKAFNNIDNANVPHLLAWAKPNALLHVAGLPEERDTVHSRLEASQVPITLDRLFAELPSITKDDIDYLIAIYNRYLQTTPSLKAAIRALADRNTGGTYSGKNEGDGFIHYLARLPALSYGTTRSIFKDFIDKAVAPGPGGLRKRKVVGRLDSHRKTALEILTPRTADTVRAGGKLPDDDEGELGMMQAFLQ